MEWGGWGGGGGVAKEKLRYTINMSFTWCPQSYLFSRSFPVNFISPGSLFIISFASNPLMRKNGG